MLWRRESSVSLAFAETRLSTQYARFQTWVQRTFWSRIPPRPQAQGEDADTEGQTYGWTKFQPLWSLLNSVVGVYGTEGQAALSYYDCTYGQP